jgi:hypothetical protein
MEFIVGYERTARKKAGTLLSVPHAPPPRVAAPRMSPTMAPTAAWVPAALPDALPDDRLPEPPPDPLRKVVVMVLGACILAAAGWLIYQTAFSRSGKGPIEEKPVVQRKDSSPEPADQRRAALDRQPPVAHAPGSPPIETRPAAIKPPEKPANRVEEKPAAKPPEKVPEKPPEQPKENPRPQLVYADHVLPVLRTKCLSCHGADDPRGGLDLSSLAALQKGGNNGEAVVPGSLDRGTLWENIRSGQMPPGRRAKLTDAEKKVLRDWILSARDGKLASR